MLPFLPTSVRDDPPQILALHRMTADQPLGLAIKRHAVINEPKLHGVPDFEPLASMTARVADGDAVGFEVHHRVSSANLRKSRALDSK
jgi:hypothetical protein